MRCHSGHRQFLSPHLLCRRVCGGRCAGQEVPAGNHRGRLGCVQMLCKFGCRCCCCCCRSRTLWLLQLQCIGLPPCVAQRSRRCLCRLPPPTSVCPATQPLLLRPAPTCPQAAWLRWRWSGSSKTRATPDRQLSWQRAGRLLRRPGPRPRPLGRWNAPRSSGGGGSMLGCSSALQAAPPSLLELSIYLPTLFSSPLSCASSRCWVSLLI